MEQPLDQLLWGTLTTSRSLVLALRLQLQHGEQETMGDQVGSSRVGLGTGERTEDGPDYKLGLGTLPHMISCTGSLVNNKT